MAAIGGWSSLTAGLSGDIDEAPSRLDARGGCAPAGAGLRDRGHAPVPGRLFGVRAADYPWPVDNSSAPDPGAKRAQSPVPMTKPAVAESELRASDADRE